MITEQQYQRLMNEYQSSGVVDHAAMKAGMDRKTARRYLRTGLRPAELRKPHTWRTREDPLAVIWPETVRWLEESPEVEAKALFEHLLAAHPGKLDGRALRTFQRRTTDWLHRPRFGHLDLGDLPAGQWRGLSLVEFSGPTLSQGRSR